MLFSPFFFFFFFFFSFLSFLLLCKNVFFSFPFSSSQNVPPSLSFHSQFPPALNFCYLPILYYNIPTTPANHPPPQNPHPHLLCPDHHSPPHSTPDLPCPSLSPWTCPCPCPQPPFPVLSLQPNWCDSRHSSQ